MLNPFTMPSSLHIKTLLKLIWIIFTLSRCYDCSITNSTPGKRSWGEIRKVPSVLPFFLADIRQLQSIKLLLLVFLICLDAVGGFSAQIGMFSAFWGLQWYTMISWTSFKATWRYWGLRTVQWKVYQFRMRHIDYIVICFQFWRFPNSTVCGQIHTFLHSEFCCQIYPRWSLKRWDFFPAQCLFTAGINNCRVNSINLRLK